MSTAAEAAASSRRRRRRRKKLSRKQERRRRLLRSALALGAIAFLQPLAWLPVLRGWRIRLRPPGALDEAAFLGACIKCGQCVQVCPVQAIALADVDEGFGVGVPFIDSRAQACDFSCDALSCILACPTGALDHALSAKEEVRAGTARLARPDACLARAGRRFGGVARGRAFRGRLRYPAIDRWTPLPVRDHPYNREICDLCVLECPIGESAIGMVPMAGSERGLTPEVRDGCVGCGVCEMICPQDPAVIVVDPQAENATA